MSKILIPDVQHVSWVLLKSNPPQLKITATGVVPTGGWTAPELAHPALRPDGTLLLDFLIEPPASGSLVTQVLQSHEAVFTYADAASVNQVRRIRVLGANGDWVEVEVSPEPARLPAKKAELLSWSPEIPLPWPYPPFPHPFPHPFPPQPQPLPVPLPDPFPPKPPLPWPNKPPLPPLLISGLKGYTIRVLNPGDVATADFQPRRINFHLDAQGHIERHSFY